MASPAPAQEADRLYLRGVSLWNAHRHQDAIALLDAALKEKPDFPEALCMGGYILREQGRIEPALNFYRRALELKSDFIVAWSNLGKMLFELRRFIEALACFNKIIVLTPQDADAWNNRACALRELGRLNEAARASRKAIELAPHFAEARLNLGSVLLKSDHMEEALSAYREAQNLSPDLASAYCGEALALRALDRLDEARTAFKKAEALGSVEAISGRGCLDLMLGDFANGWEGYEHRWISGRSLSDALGARHPTWDGVGKPGLRVLVMSDHGLGDTIQFFRYISLMLERGMRVDFLCPGKLHRLLALDPRLRLRDHIDPSEPYDRQIAVSSLPRAFKTRLEDIPSSVPYLRAEPALKDVWSKKIGERGFRIGVVWQGNPNPEADMARSIPLEEYGPLGAIPGVRLISLQKGFGVEQLGKLPPGMTVETLGDGFDSGPDAFIDAAAAMHALDLIVTCDTSIAHLAGALGRPIWLALKRDAEWRWLRDRDDSPWYPTMRLFRQETRGDWRGVFARMRKEISDHLAHSDAVTAIAIPVPVGELIDKITILEIKAKRLEDEDGKLNVVKELHALRAVRRAHGLDRPELRELSGRLLDVNATLWDIENDIRECERKLDFGEFFVRLARAVYFTNDERAGIKRAINALCNSSYVEEKSYSDYKTQSRTA